MKHLPCSNKEKNIKIRQLLLTLQQRMSFTYTEYINNRLTNRQDNNIRHLNPHYDPPVALNSCVSLPLTRHTTDDLEHTDTT